ncbi:hypothetical protein HGRIS_001725 [Hohenbuehelia grisea]|uniref:alpha-L-fucosidase n=1 Tax=Hohenbuehelia grisea TaxID=104357 RepID=A0ABR3JJ43_9AGAR
MRGYPSLRRMNASSRMHFFKTLSYKRCFVLSPLASTPSTPMVFGKEVHLGLVLLGLFGHCLAASPPQFTSTPIPISGLFDNQAASVDGSADFDGKGSSFDSSFLPPGPWNYDGISYDLPQTWGSQPDNVIANGQVVRLAKPVSVHELHFLYAGDDTGNEFVANFRLNFSNQDSQPVQLYAKNYYRWPLLNDGAIQTPYNFVNHGADKNWNKTQIYQWSTSIPSEAELESITFPLMNPSHRLHLFALSLSESTPQSSNSTPALAIRRMRFTSRWELVDGVRAQAVEVTLANTLPSRSLAPQTSLIGIHQLTITGDGIRTLAPGVIHRLVPGDQARVDVLVSGSQDGILSTIHVTDANNNSVVESSGWPATPLVENWTPDADLLATHESPSWWKQAKYGIFIHWGVYSYPAWASPNNYAEWYTWDLHNPPDASNPTWNHHLETYGPDVVYDDFIPKFTASKFNASSWVDLFDRAGAKYFVLVTKHHDGFALFETGNTTNRNSLKLGPKRDLVAELLDTAKREKPDLHRGTYYSLPEWFNPDYAKYGFGPWPGGLAHNAFNSTEIEPYTGYVNVTDYIDDLQYPHMLDLALRYDTEIMWCDIGGPNRTLDFAAQFYNHAMASGKQVTMNNRCGAVPDFDTPEYATFGSIQPQNWESSEGMDPFSYGLNSATSASQYKNGTTIVQTLVDIVSKNGNFLLDIGPTAEGEIIEPMVTNLLDAGSWLAHSGDCVYSTTYSFQGSQDIDPPAGSPPARFTRTPTTFCIIAFARPASGTLVIQKRLPVLPGDEIVFMKPGGPSSPLEWEMDEGGKLTIKASESDLNEVQFAWAFQVRYGQ